MLEFRYHRRPAAARLAPRERVVLEQQAAVAESGRQRAVIDVRQRMPQRRQAFTLLTESRKSLKLNAPTNQPPVPEPKPATTISVRPPITDLLKDIYQDDQSPTN